MSRKSILFSLATLFVLASCGPQKKNIVARTYHNTVAYFNGYYHANVNYQLGVKQLDQSTKVPTEGFLPLILTTPPEGAQATYIYFDTAIKKDDILLHRHPNSNWADDARFLTGRCHYFKSSFSNAVQNFNYVLFAYPKSKLVPEVQLWLGKAYYVQGNNYRALEILKSVNKPAIRKNRTRVELAELEATLYIQQQKYAEAADALEHNLKSVKKPARKAKWHYLLGQLYDELDNVPLAHEHFDKCARLNASSELTFLAQLRLAGLYANGQAPTHEKLDEVRGRLQKLLRDQKYAKFRDQIYYQMALLEEVNGNDKKALELLKKSLLASKDNPRQKMLSYYHCGEIYFNDQRDFYSAGMYYDSAAKIATPQMAEYEEVKEMSTTLGAFIQCHNTIHTQDSLLALSLLTPEEQKAAAERVVQVEDSVKQAREEEMRRRQEEQRLRNQNNPIPPPDDPANQTAGTTFYFDDQAQVSRGKMVFESLWGQRPNEDHWQRKNKNAVIMSPTSNNTAVADTVDSTGKKVDRRIAAMLKNIPSKPAERDSSNAKVRQALYQLGDIYTNRLDMPDSGLYYWNILTRRYPNDQDQTPKAFYAVYTSSKERNNNPEADRAKKALLERYPNSVYAKIIQKGPTGALDETQRKEFNDGFQVLTNMYDAHDWETATEFSRYLADKFKEHPEVSRIYYVRGLAFGQAGQMDSLKSTFEYLVRKYPSDDVSLLAQKTLALMRSGGQEPVPSDNGGAVAQQGTSGQPAANSDPRFLGFEIKAKPNDPIFVVMLIEKGRIKNNELNVLMADFNRQFFENERITARVFQTKQDSTDFWLVYVSQFGDFASAEAYAKVARTYGKLTALMRSPQDDVMPVTPNNFRVAMAQRRFADYNLFYKANHEEMGKKGP